MKDLLTKCERLMIFEFIPNLFIGNGEMTGGEVTPSDLWGVIENQKS